MLPQLLLLLLELRLLLLLLLQCCYPFMSCSKLVLHGSSRRLQSCTALKSKQTKVQHMAIG